MMKKNKKKKMSYAMGGQMRASVAAGQTMPQILKREKLTYGMGGKKKMSYPGGGKMKKVDAAKNPGLAKLPTEVRNKMGYMAMGGKMDADKEFMYGGKMKKGMYGMKMKKNKMGMGGKFLNQHD